MTCYQIILLSRKITLNGAYQSHMTSSCLCTFSSPLSNLEIAFNICLKNTFTYRPLEQRPQVLPRASRKMLLVLASRTYLPMEMKSRMWLCKWCRCRCEMDDNCVWRWESVSTCRLGVILGLAAAPEAKVWLETFWLLLLFGNKTCRHAREKYITGTGCR